MTLLILNTTIEPHKNSRKYQDCDGVLESCLPHEVCRSGLLQMGADRGESVGVFRGGRGTGGVPFGFVEFASQSHFQDSSQR